MGFSFPQGLFSLGFLAVLVWIYLQERHQRTLDVPSLLLWQAVREEARRSRFEIDPLFLVQAALLAALGLAMAHPYWSRPATAVALGRAVIVFDTSASMQTIEDGERRFDRARRRARELLAAVAPANEVMVIAVEARPRVVVAFTRDRQAVGRAVETLEPGDGPSRLSLGIQLARAARSPAEGRLEIAVFTDLPRAELSAPLGPGERLRYFRFGRTDDNVALAALRVYQSPFQDAGEARAYALVKNYSRQEKKVDLRVALDAREILREELRLAPREGRAVPIRKLPGTGRLEARLEVADALAVDNRALAYVRPVQPIRLLAVTDNDAFGADLSRLADAIPALRLDRITPAAYREDDSRPADVALFHGFVPEGSMRSNALFVYPPSGNPLFPVERDVTGAQILDWNDRHPILRDLRYVEALPLDHARRIRPPGWARALIVSRAGAEEFPLAFAGELEGRRLACFAFDLADRSVARSENLSLLLLVLNALKWLTPPDPRLPIQVDIGDRYRESFVRRAAYRVTAPDGSVAERPETGEIAVDVDRRGEYRVVIGDAERTIYANLFDSEESNIGRDGRIEEELTEEGSATSVEWVAARFIREYGGWLYRLAILLLVAEWLLSMRRRQARVA